jgi:hypothetical protein
MCLLVIFRMTFSKCLPVVDRRLIGRKFCGNLGSLPGFSKVVTFAHFQEFWKCDRRRQWPSKCVRHTSGLLRRCLRHSFWIHLFHRTFSISIYLFIFLCLSVLLFQGGCPLEFRADLGLQLPPVFHGFRHTGVNVFSEESTIALASSFGRYFIPEGPCTGTAAGAFVPSHFWSIGHLNCCWASPA